MHARPFVAAILAIRELSKQLEFFTTEIDLDGRFRASYNIAGTETGRASSSENAFGTGGNAQNISPSLRYVFESDPGWKLCVIDLEQVEARDVGWFCGALFDDWTFLDACESGDLHTTNSTLIWPEQSWGTTPAQARERADRPFYREFSFRDMAKRGGHLTNYLGQPWTMARSLKIPIKLAEDFQSRYCTGPSAAFPAIPRFWQWVATQLQTTHQLVTPFGRQRHFFGRPGDDTTLREAIAYLPQSTTADRINLGLWRVWYHMPQIQVLAQTHDSVTFQYRESDDENAVIRRALELLRVELLHTAVSGRVRRYVVPGEAKIGWNWGNVARDGSNDEGLLKWNGAKPDVRKRRTGLQRIIL
jgi:DNA polymerase I-like protein with 3'-5' exonuclease and polymerase domains